MREQDFTFDIPEEEPHIIHVIGVGGGGSNAVNHMYRQGIKGVGFVVCNTDNQALQNSPVPNKIQLGQALTFGRGAGNEPEMGRQAALENEEEVRSFLSRSAKMIFLTAGMGGGTGTGAAPVIASVAREMKILTVAIVTLPFSFEGQKRWAQAVDGIKNLKDHVDALLIIHNDRLREIFGDQKLSVAFGHADNVLAMAAKGIAEIITVHGYVNVDFADVRTVMEKSGVAIMGTGIAEGEQRAHEAIKQALVSPLLNNNNLKGARNILLNVVSGAREVLMDEITEIMDFVHHCTGIESDIIWGNTYDASLGDSLVVTIVATGLEEEIGIGALRAKYKQKVTYGIDQRGEAVLPKDPADDIPFEIERDGEGRQEKSFVLSEERRPGYVPEKDKRGKSRSRENGKTKGKGWIQATLGGLFDEKDDELE